MEYVLETPFSTMVCLFISSDIMKTPFFTAMSAIAFNSSGRYAAPVGLDGLFITIAFVAGVIASSNSSGVILKPFSSRAGRITGVAPDIATITGYDTQYGAGIITSSPFSKNARDRLKNDCLPPQDTSISSRV